MNLNHVVTRHFAPVEQSYDARDCALYALALGIGSNPLDEDELPYVFEGRQQLVVPSWCGTLGWPAFWHDDPATGIDWRRIVHGEVRFQLHQPLPLHTTVRAQHAIAGVQDKGIGRGALIHFDTELHSAADGVHLASVQSVQFLRGDGGCGSHGAAREGLPPLDESVRPHATADYATAQQAALLYRLASRDLMPVHADPEVARSGGFERPISHGLNTMGIACRSILKHFIAGHPERLRAMAARFTQHGYPGDTLRVEMFGYGEVVQFRVRALERDVVLLDRGNCILEEPTWLR